MKSRLTLLLSLACAFLPLATPLHSSDPPPTHLVAVGGGGVSDEMYRHLLALSPADTPRVLVIPHAARVENLESRGRDMTKTFQDLGVSEIDVLDLEHPERALRAIGRADVIWMPGGIQRRLMRALDEADVADAIRERFAAGIPVGGTSAGAAIMSETMLAGSRRDDETGVQTPIISHGLGFWPPVIVDQHFTERDRLGRLENAVREHPGLVGVGIDERTAVVVGNGTRFRVMGEGTVTVVRALESDGDDIELNNRVLHPGEIYKLENR